MTRPPLRDFCEKYGELRDFREKYGELRDFHEKYGELPDFHEKYGELRDFREKYGELAVDLWNGDKVRRTTKGKRKPYRCRQRQLRSRKENEGNS